MENPARLILVRSPNWIGDQILAYPFFKELRKKHPQARVIALASSTVASLQYRHLVDDVIELENARRPSRLEKVRVVFRNASRIQEYSRGQSFDLGLLLTPSFSSALMMRLAGVKLVRGYASDARSFFLHEKLTSPSKAVHRSLSYLKLVGSDVQPAEVSKEKFDWKRAWTGPFQEPPNEPFFVIAPGSNASSRRWDVERFFESVQKLQRTLPALGLIVGGPKEKSIAETLLKIHANQKASHSGMPRLEDFTSRGAVASYAPIFEKAHLTLANDSGLAHVAALCGARVHIVWGAGNPLVTLPIGPAQVGITKNEISCWPCEKNTCKFGDQQELRCLRGISAEQVSKAILESMN